LLLRPVVQGFVRAASLARSKKGTTLQGPWKNAKSGKPPKGGGAFEKTGGTRLTGVENGLQKKNGKRKAAEPQNLLPIATS